MKKQYLIKTIASTLIAGAFLFLAFGSEDSKDSSSDTSGSSGSSGTSGSSGSSGTSGSSGSSGTSGSSGSSGTSGSSGSSGTSGSSGSSGIIQKVNKKPKLCDCQNYFWKDVEDAMNFGKTEPSAFSKKCEKYYTVEELINADCGLTKYDPNFKAK